MVCKEAPQGTGVIGHFTASSRVLPGNVYKVSAVITSKASYLGGDYKVELVDNDTNIVLETQNIYLGAGASKTVNFTGRMQSKDANLNLSLTDIKSVWWDSCEDYRDFTIFMATSAADEKLGNIAPIEISDYLIYAGIALVIVTLIVLILRRH